MHFYDHFPGKHLTKAEILEYAGFLHNGNVNKPSYKIIRHVKICDECAKRILAAYYELYMDNSFPSEDK